jgi:hypothetical protein
MAKLSLEKRAELITEILCTFHGHEIFDIKKDADWIEHLVDTAANIVLIIEGRAYHDQLIEWDDEKEAT